MFDPALGSLTINLLASGVAAGTGVGAGKVRSALRKRQVSESIGDVATEFNKALKQAIEEENERRDSGELADVTADWEAVADHLAATEAAPDETARHEREEIDILFEDEEEAVARLAEAIGAVHEGVGAAMRADPDIRAAIEEALTRAYRRAVADFERRVAADEELAAVFEAETDLVLAERLEDLQDRLDDQLKRLETIQQDVDRLLTQDVRNEGFRQLSPDYFERVSPSPETCWRTTFTLADVHAGIPAARSGHEAETTARDELLDALWRGEDQLVVGLPGAGKSTLCKRAAVRWYRAEQPGDVLYHESGGGGRQFESTGALADAIERADSPVLVVVEDAARPAANAILDVMEAFRDDPDVRFLLDARQTDVDQFTSTDAADPRERRHADLLGEIPRYQLPAVSEADVAGVVEAFEQSTERSVGQDVASLHDEVTGEVAEKFGAFLLLSFHLPVGGDTLDSGEAETGLEAHVTARHETLADPGSAEALRDLSGFDPELLADVGVMVNLLNAAGIGIHPELVHALAYEHTPSVDTDDDLTDICEALESTHDEIAEVRAALEGWFLYPTGRDEGPVRTTHELWSTLYLRHLAREHVAREAEKRRRDRSEPRVGRCLEALFRLCDEESYREALAFEFPGSDVLASIADDSQAAATEYAESVFELGNRWPVLAPLFGTTQTARYDLPETLPEDRRRWIVTTRGNAHRKRGAYAKARTEYERRLEKARKSDNRVSEAGALNNLGLVAGNLGEYELAREYHHQSLDIKRDIGDRQGEATNLNNLGNVAQRLGEYEDAREYYHQSLDIQRDIGDRNGEATSLMNLGSVAEALGEYEDAREYHHQSIDIQRDIGDRNGEARSLNNLGNVALRLSEYEDAREYYRQSLDIFRDIGDRNGEAKSLNNLGLVARNLGEYEDAREYHHQSLDIKRDIGDRNGETKSLESLGLVAKALGEYETARDYYDASRNLYSQLGLVRDELRTRRNRIRLERDADNLDRARERCEAALERLDSLDRDLPDEREKIEELRDQLDGE